MPNLKLTRTRGEERGIGTGFHPMPVSAAHVFVQARAALLSENWPELVSALSNGFPIFSSPAPMITSGMYPASVAVGVGQDEEAATPMASAHFSRREQARFCAVAQAAKPSDDVGKSQIDVPFDVLDKDSAGADFIDDPLDFGPQVPGIGLALALPCGAERLARITGSEDMNLAAPWLAVEGSEIVPDRRAIQGRVCHPGHESGRCMGFPFDETDSAIGGLGDREAELETAVTCAEGKAVDMSGLVAGIAGMDNHKRGLRRRSIPRSRRAHRPQLIDLAAASALDLDRACQRPIICLEQQRVASAAPKRLLHHRAPITAPP